MRTSSSKQSFRQAVSAVLCAVMIVSLLGGLIAAPVPASAAPITETRTKAFQYGLDGYTGTQSVQISQDAPTTNYGGSSEMAFGIGASGNETQSLLQFDLSAIPWYATVTGATLTLNQAVGGSDSGNAVLAIHQMVRDWDDNTITWDTVTSSVYYDPAPASLLPAGGVTADNKFDLELPLSLVQQWVETPADNDGFLLRVESSDSGSWSRTVDTEKSPAQAVRPVLTVTYKVSTDEIILQQGLNDYDGAEDVHLAEGYPRYNFGGMDRDLVGRLQYSATDRKRTLYRFDLSSIPATADIASATLELHVIAGQPQSTTIEAREVLEPWEEGIGTNQPGHPEYFTEVGVSWDKMPDYAATPVDTQTVGLPVGTTHSFALTELVRQWVDGSKPNYGVVLMDRNEGTLVANSKTFASSEYGDPTKRPILRVRYYVPTTGVEVTPSSLTLVLNGGAEQLNAQVLPITATVRNVQWTSSNPAVATVDADGFVTPVGLGTAIITATAEDGNYTDTSTVTVVENTRLSNLTLSQGVLTPAFNGATTGYSATVDSSVTSVTVTPTASDPAATVTVNGQPVANGSASLPISLHVGANTIKTEVTSASGTERRTYSIIVYRQPGTNPDLTHLALSAGTLSPAFASGVTGYSATVASSEASVDVTPMAADPNAVITVNGEVVGSGEPRTIPLNVGANIVKVLVTAEDGTTQKLYTVTVTRPPSTNADLSDLSLSTREMSPAFSSGTLSYNASVGYDVTGLTVTPTAADPNATITVNGQPVASGTASANIPLSVGNNTIVVTVTAEDGSTRKTYAVTVNRALSNVAHLTSLKVSEGSLAPAFVWNTYAYRVGVANHVTEMTVTPTAADSNATVTVNGQPVASGTASQSIPLGVGDNVIGVTVTAQDGVTTKTYTVTVNRAPSTNANLNNLSVSEGGLSPSFASGITAYSVSVANSVYGLTVMPTVAEANATVTVNGEPVASAEPSSWIPLHVGDNAIIVTVTAQDGVTTKTYSVTVNRAPSDSAYLTNLELSDGVLSPAFRVGTTSYAATVANSVDDVTVTPTTADPNATVRVNGIGASSGAPFGPIPLTVGDNAITVTVTAEDGMTTKTYTVTVTRAASNSADLSNLALSEGSLSPSFASGVTDYTADVASNVPSVKVTMWTADPNATVKANGNDAHSGVPSRPIPLRPGVNVIVIEVTAQDGTTTETYTVTVNRAAGTNADLSNLALSSGSLSPDFTSGETSYTATVEHDVTSVTVTPTATDPNATIDVNGQPVASAGSSSSIPLNVGSDNWIEVTVTAEDGVTSKPYTIQVTRQGTVPPPEEEDDTDGGNGGVSTPAPVKPTAPPADQPEHPNPPESAFACPKLTWADVDNHWAQASIELASQLCIVRGVSSDTFMPNVETTRLQFALMVARAMNVQNTEDTVILDGFADRNDVPDWAAAELSAAVKAGIILGYGDNTLRPHQKINRAEMVTMLMRGVGIPAAATASSFADDAAIPDWARGYVAKAEQLGIVIGRANNRFEPSGPATRAEAVVVLVRMFKDGP